MKMDFSSLASALKNSVGALTVLTNRLKEHTIKPNLFNAVSLNFFPFVFFYFSHVVSVVSFFRYFSGVSKFCEKNL